MSTISFNLKAKKKCDADGMILHCVNDKARKKSDNLAFPENSHLNASSPDLFEKYKNLTEKIEDIKGKKIQKNANHYLEGVLGFNREQYEKDPEGFREKAPKLIEKYMQDIKEKYGFEPCGFSLHFDEGKLNDETGKIELNVHAHCSFVNYDFEQNKARFRDIQKKYVSDRKFPNEHFVAMQDMAGECFKTLGFTRGVSKQVTKTKHLEKVEFVQNKLNEKIEKIANLENKLIDIKDQGKDKIIKLKKAEKQLVSVGKIGKKAISDIRKVREILENEQETLKDISSANNQKNFESKKIEKKISRLEKIQKNILENINSVVVFSVSVSSSFLKLVTFRKEKKLEEYNENIENLKTDFENLNDKLLIENKSNLKKIVDNIITELPEITDLEKATKKDIKAKIGT